MIFAAERSGLEAIRETLDGLACHCVQGAEDVSKRPTRWRPRLVEDHVISEVTIEKRSRLDSIRDDHLSGPNRKERLGNQLCDAIVIQDEVPHSKGHDAGQQEPVFLSIVQLLNLRQVRPYPGIPRSPWLDCLDTVASVLEALDSHLHACGVSDDLLPVSRVVRRDNGERTLSKPPLVIHSCA